jgi:AcrR family transcriptional regulator
MTKPPKRKPLTREAVVAAGLAIGDAEGLEAVSLRRVAAELGVTPMALYRYVESKEELLDEMLAAVWGKVEIPNLASGDWWERLAALAHSARSAFLSHPAAAAIAATRPRGGKNIVRVIEVILALFERAGLDSEHAARIYLPFARSLLALIVFEASLLPELSEEERRQEALRTRFEFESLPAGEFSHVIAAAPHLARPYEPERVFEEGLEFLHAGIEAQLPGPTRRAKPRR